MTCPSCQATLSRGTLFFATPQNTIHCRGCHATLQISWASRVLLLLLSFLAATAAGQGLRAAGLGDIVAVAGLVAAFVGAYWVAVGFLPRLRVVPDDPTRIG